MKLFDLLNIQGAIRASTCKIHLACYTGIEDPLDVFRAGNFKTWQEVQNQKNFEREYILGLIQMPQKAQWLYAGVFLSRGCVPNPERRGFLYSTLEESKYSEFIGRLTVSFERPGRQPYLLAENWSDTITVSEITKNKLSIPEFSGYKSLSITKSLLDIIIKDAMPSWRAALSSVSGVYLISDVQTGKLYVGSAYGDGGFWARWSDYSISGHGGNVGLLELLGREGLAYTQNFRFSILEVCDSSASKDDVISREVHWKVVLASHKFGYNQN